MEQAVKQLDAMTEKLEKFKALLTEKLDPTEVTHARYAGTADQVMLAVLDNLRRIISAAKGADAIDLDYANERLGRLKAERAPLSAADQEEKRTLEERVGTHAGQARRIDELLTFNERALTQLTKTTIAVSSIHTSKDLAGADIESAMSELAQLTERAAAYSRS